MKKPSNEVCAVLRLDNQEVGNTGWKVANQSCWDARFSLELDRRSVKNTILSNFNVFISASKFVSARYVRNKSNNKIL